MNNSKKRMSGRLMYKKGTSKVVLKSGINYTFAKVGSSDLDKMLDGVDKLGKYQVDLIAPKIKTEGEIKGENFRPYGRAEAINEFIESDDKGKVDRESFKNMLTVFFRKAINYVGVYQNRSPSIEILVEIQELKIYESNKDNVVTYHINGLAQLLREINS